MITLQSIIINNHPTLDDIELDLSLKPGEVPTQGTFIRNNSHFSSVKVIGTELSSPIEEIGFIFRLLSSLDSEFFPEFRKEYFAEELTSFTIKYLINEIECLYMLSISCYAVHSQILIADGEIVHEEQVDVDYVIVPEELKAFIDRIIYINPNDTEEITYMVKSGYDLCELEESRKFLSDVLISLGLTTDPLRSSSNNTIEILDIGDTTYKPIEDSNRTTQILFGIMSTLIFCLQRNCFVVINDFNNIDIVKKSRLISFFLSTALNSAETQLLVTDSFDYLQYTSILPEPYQVQQLRYDDHGHLEII